MIKVELDEIETGDILNALTEYMDKPEIDPAWKARLDALWIKIDRIAFDTYSPGYISAISDSEV